MLHPDDLEDLRQQFTTLLNRPGHSITVEYRLCHKNGTRRWMEGTATNLLLDPTIQAIVVNFRDTTERKEVERRKQEFLSMVSHELRTPLTALMGLIEIALLQIEQRPGTLAPEAEELIIQVERMLKQANGQVEIETRLVEDLLEASRPGMHTFELSLQRENLVTIVEETVANQQQVARTRQIELVLPPAKVVPVLVDAGRIGQVLTNYLTNALKFAPAEQVVSVCLEVEASVARVSVRDQGPGLTPEEQQRVWERFYQAAAPEHRGADGGLGLGLAIAKAIVEQHHGQVGVESLPGRGSTFWFTVPLADGGEQCGEADNTYAVSDVVQKHPVRHSKLQRIDEDAPGDPEKGKAHEEPAS